MAEFTLLGATWNGQKSAQEYFTDGITASVKGYDYVAGQNHIPYYDSPYVNDPHDVSIKLQEEWLTELLKKEAYNLSGDKASDLEKCISKNISIILMHRLINMLTLCVLVFL